MRSRALYILLACSMSVLVVACAAGTHQTYKAPNLPGKTCRIDSAEWPKSLPLDVAVTMAETNADGDLAIEAMTFILGHKLQGTDVAREVADSETTIGVQTGGGEKSTKFIRKFRECLVTKTAVVLQGLHTHEFTSDTGERRVYVVRCIPTENLEIPYQRISRLPLEEIRQCRDMVMKGVR